MSARDIFHELQRLGLIDESESWPITGNFELELLIRRLGDVEEDARTAAEDRRAVERLQERWDDSLHAWKDELVSLRRNAVATIEKSSPERGKQFAKEYVISQYGQFIDRLTRWRERVEGLDGSDDEDD